MKIAIGADHAGYALKEQLKTFLGSLGHEVKDFGAHALDPNDDYPDFMFPVAHAVANGEVQRGIIIGSSGQGEAIAANRVKGVRAVVYYGEREPYDKTAKTGPQKSLIESVSEDNNANVLAIGASFVSPEEAGAVVEEWLSLSFPGEERHLRRIKKLDA